MAERCPWCWRGVTSEGCYSAQLELTWFQWQVTVNYSDVHAAAFCQPLLTSSYPSWFCVLCWVVRSLPQICDFISSAGQLFTHFVPVDPSWCSNCQCNQNAPLSTWNRRLRPMALDRVSETNYCTSERTQIGTILTSVCVYCCWILEQWPLLISSPCELTANEESGAPPHLTDDLPEPDEPRGPPPTPANESVRGCKRILNVQVVETLSSASDQNHINGKFLTGSFE